MPFADLIEAADLLLSENGVFAVIILSKRKMLFWLLPKNMSHPIKITRVKGTLTTEVKRSLLAFGRNENLDLIIDELVIENARHIYTEEYIELTRSFI
jgi:tRNA1Val (adenine37-N6)-methyltransferase